MLNFLNFTFRHANCYVCTILIEHTASDCKVGCCRFSCRIPAFSEFHTYVVCLQDLNEAHGVVAELHSKFFGLPHMFAVVKLLGSRSLPWLVRALLDYLSQKVNCIDTSSNKLTLYKEVLVCNIRVRRTMLQSIEALFDTGSF
jgi:hypothetical protein